MLIVALAAASLVAPVLAIASPPPPPVAADLRCLAVLATTVSSLPETKRAGAIGGVMYFLGRIDAVAPGFDYNAALAALVAADPEGKTIAAEAPRCAAVMKERGESLITMGNALRGPTGR
jgi:hypothetical protein